MRALLAGAALRCLPKLAHYLSLSPFLAACRAFRSPAIWKEKAEGHSERKARKGRARAVDETIHRYLIVYGQGE